MKKFIVILLAFALVFSGTFISGVEIEASAAPKEFSQTPAEFVKRIGAGWNLGNTLDSYVSGTPSVYEQETGWNNPYTQQGMIAKVAQSGFNAVRIPVSWGPQTAYSNGKYTINESWLKRVKQIVDWCYQYDMYVIVNMHHDDGNWLDIGAITDDQWASILEQYGQMWQQIATYFKDYDEHLILEGANELTASSYFCGCGSDPTNNCWWGHNTDLFYRQYELYDIFVSTVRGTGSNNAYRYLMLPTYGAQWYEHQIQNLALPEDERLIVDIHWYDHATQINSAKRKTYADMWANYSRIRGYGIVIGECGFTEATSDSYKASWANSFVADVRKNYGIPVFLWDDGGSMKILNRNVIPYAWTSNSTLYVNAVVSVSAPYIVEPPKIIYGDVNLDNEFGMSDLLLFKKYLFKAPGYIKELPEEADVNCDGKYDLKDLLLMTKVQAGKASF